MRRNERPKVLERASIPPRCAPAHGTPQSLVNHCPHCGTAAVRAHVEGRDRWRCPACAFVLFENPACAAAGLVLDARRRVLLVRRALEPYQGSWALPAGYQEIDEPLSDTALREVEEESGIVAEVVELFDVLFVAVDRRKASNLAVYLCRPVGGVLRAGHDALEAAWFDLDALPADLAFENGPRILERLAREPRAICGESGDARPGSRSTGEGR